MQLLSTLENTWENETFHLLCNFQYFCLLLSLLCRYHDEQHNCIDFVLEFLKSVSRFAYIDADILTDKVMFCERLIVPETAKAAKYISLYRQLVVEKVVIKAV